jgi:metallo-beta-lactamase family protein
MQSTLYFYGGAGQVTGSNFLLETGGAKILVDCGLMQGVHEEKNWESFAYDPKEISHLIVTHAHLDHIGRIPKLVKDGFKGTIISTKATEALAEPLLLDALEIVNHTAERRGRDSLFEEADVAGAMKLWRGIGYQEKISLPDDVELELLDAGHILGSAMVRLTRAKRSIVFTGDLGGGNSPLMAPTHEVSECSYLVMEGTYGDRARPEDTERREQLENIIEESVARGGTLLIPAFSTERTQDLMYEIRTLMVEKRVPSVPVFVDSPLAERITRAFRAHPEYFAQDIRARVEGGEDIFGFSELRFVKDVEASRKIKDTPNPKIILAGSGMSSGGRVLAHEREYLPDPQSTLLIVGYQAAGTLGRRLIEGAKSLELHKEKIPVRAKVETLYGYSAHRDGEGLVEFANHAAQHADEVFVVHAEPSAASFLVQRIRDYLGVKASAPEAASKVVLEF